METPHVDEELLSYRVIDLSVLPLLLPTEIEKYSDIFLSFTKGKIHEPVELRGEGDLFTTLFFFLWLRRTVPEICYRQKAEEAGEVIFSIYGRNEKLRPVWMQETKELSKEEKESVKRIAKEISFEDNKVDIAFAWQKIATEFREGKTLFLVQLFDGLLSDEKKVFIEGTIPNSGALLVMNYLVSTHRVVVWNGILIQ